MANDSESGGQNVYGQIIVKVFFSGYEEGCRQFEFDREELERAASDLGLDAPKNLGDIIYSFRHRAALPAEIAVTASEGREWVIEGAGRSRYRFRLAALNRVAPNESLYQIKIPDATPEIISMYAKGDEQALLAKVRYNRLVDIFLGVTAYSLQSHMRTTVPGVGQIEVDELYVGVCETGRQFIVPVQAKGGRDQIGATQVRQDLELCRHAFSNLTPRLMAVQFLREDVIAMFELAFQDDDLRVVNERHYVLVAGAEISADDLAEMETHAR